MALVPLCSTATAALVLLSVLREAWERAAEGPEKSWETNSSPDLLMLCEPCPRGSHRWKTSLGNKHKTCPHTEICLSTDRGPKQVAFSSSLGNQP